jgi:hypothetical protein
LKGGLIKRIQRVVFDGVFDNYGCAASGCSVWVIGVVDCVIGNTEVSFRGEMGFRDEQNMVAVVVVFSMDEDVSKSWSIFSTLE